MELMTREEKSLLMYFEPQATDYGGTLESVMAKLNVERKGLPAAQAA